MNAQRRLRVLVATLRYPPYVAGGYELFTRDAVESLRARDHDVHVLTGRGRGFDQSAGILPWLDPDLDGEDPFELSFGASNAERFRLHFLRFSNYRRTKKALEATSADVLFFFNLGGVSLAPVLAARHRGVPTLGFVSDPWPLNHWLLAWQEDEPAARAKALRLRLLERFWVGFRDTVGLGPLLVCSAYLRERLARSGLPAETTEVLHLGVSPDMEVRTAACEVTTRSGDEPLRVVCISSLWRGKGQDVLLDAVREARAKGGDIEVVLASPSAEPGFRSRLEDLAREPELAPAVRFEGRLSREELAALMARAHVLVVPSVWGEPFPLSTLEGMAHALAVVTSDAGGCPEAIREGVNGFVVRAGDAGALAHVLLRLEGDEELRRGVAAQARDDVRARFSHERFVDGIERSLQRVADPQLHREGEPA